MLTYQSGGLTPYQRFTQYNSGVVPGQTPAPSTGGGGVPMNTNDANHLTSQYGLGGSQSTTEMVRRLMMGGSYPLLASQYNFANSLQPDTQAFIRQKLEMLKHPEQMIGGYREQAMQGASGLAAQKSQGLRVAGAPIGAQQGAQQDALNQAYHDANKFAAGVYSPEGTAKMIESLLGATSNLTPEMQNLVGMINAMNGGQHSGDGNSTIGDIATLAGVVAGFI